MTNHDRDPIRPRWTELLFVIGFLAILCYPACSLFRNSKATAGDENRSLAARPPLALLMSRPHRFARVFKAFFNDQFEARDRLVLINSMVRYWVLRTASNPAVIPGKHGTLFYAGEETFPGHNMGNELVQYRRTHPLSPAELEKLRDLLERRREWAASLGAKFLFVIAPDKSTVYPDHLPSRINRLDAPSATDQLVAYLRDESSVDVLDLRPKLIAARRQRPVYLKRDTHWNDYGAFAGYEAIALRLRALYPSIEPLRLSQTKPTDVPFTGDLAKMLNLGEQLAEGRVLLTPVPQRSGKIPFPLDGKSVPTWLAPPEATRVKGSKLPRALVYHDSFMYQMMPFLSEHFETAIYIRDTHVTLHTVKDYRPDIVIHECVERLLRQLIGLTDDLSPARQPYLIAAGEASEGRARK
jgi:alginate O-acetyltransferase complex protein AlgJ